LIMQYTREWNVRNLLGVTDRPRLRKS
jgi:hypothetical protein